MITLFNTPATMERIIKKRGPRKTTGEWIEITGSGLQSSLFDDGQESLAGFDKRCNICTLEFQQDTIAVDKVSWRGWYICDRCQLSINDALRMAEEGDDRGYGLIAKYTHEIRDNANNNRLGYGVEVVADDELLEGE